MQVETVSRQQGTGKKSGQPYNFLRVGGFFHTAEGREFAEVMLDGDHPLPEPGKTYELDYRAFADREKRLQFRLEGMKLIQPLEAV